MNQSEFSELITKKIGNLFTYSPSNQYTRVRTPFLYPDGDVIDLFYKEDGEYVVLTDLGETLGWLRMQTTDQQKSSKQRQLINDICQNLNVQLYRGMLMMRLKRSDDLAQAVMRLSQAALRVSDLWFIFKNQADEPAVDGIDD
jgi:hypothetical protein